MKYIDDIDIQHLDGSGCAYMHLLTSSDAGQSLYDRVPRFFYMHVVT